ncbi:hypothetical protein HPB52_020281 [Rhipicephalus sanguineus]|uniref:Uncharacterized protein n=1 Tax=Rhipicephalus sanguineus TaxID=34632 RepID=A0A9D4PG39_RHISA|nr:hypothetical protein HPB52_020281 [Rhipicephalus sanguineus]
MGRRKIYLTEEDRRRHQRERRLELYASFTEEELKRRKELARERKARDTGAGCERAPAAATARSRRGSRGARAKGTESYEDSVHLMEAFGLSKPHFYRRLKADAVPTVFKELSRLPQARGKTIKRKAEHRLGAVTERILPLVPLRQKASAGADRTPQCTLPRPELIAGAVERTLQFAPPSERASANAGNNVLPKLITAKRALQFVSPKRKLVTKAKRAQE